MVGGGAQFARKVCSSGGAKLGREEGMRVWLTIGIALLFLAEARAQTNSWQNTGNGFWDVAINWTQGFPATTQSVCQIVNAFTKTVTIDDVTAQFNPQTLTISNLIVQGNGTATNTVAVLNSGGVVPLLIRSNLTVGVSGSLLVSNGVVEVRGGSEGWQLDGRTEIREGGTVRVLHRVLAGLSGPGDLRVRGGVLEADSLSLSLGRASTLTLSAGRVEVARLNYIAGGLSGTGIVWISGGSLLNTNANAETRIGSSGVGRLTLSNGLFAARWANVGVFGTGTLSIHGGTFAAQSPFEVGVLGGTGTVWLTGGQLVVTNTPTTLAADTGLFVDGRLVLDRGQMGISNGVAIVGHAGTGTLTVNSGTLAVPDLSFGHQPGATGRLTLTNGTIISANGYGIGDGADTTGTALMTSGQLLATNSNGHVIVGYAGRGELTISNGVIRTRRLQAGTQPGAVGTFTIAGGSLTADEHFLLGNSTCTATGVVNQSAGVVVVTNQTGNAPLNVLSGTFALSGGTLTVNRLVVTNTCGRFIWTGGTLAAGALVLPAGLDADGDGLPNEWEQSYGLPPLRPSADDDTDGDGQTDFAEYLAGSVPTDPNSAFRVTAIDREGNHIRLTWQTVPGRTNMVQHGSGEYSPVLTNLSGAIVTSGTVTNYLHVNGAQNPTGFYRIRLLP